VTLKVNDRSYPIKVEPRKLLLDALREDARLTGTHAGCEHGVCGACTILLDGVPVRSCLLFAVQADMYEITTVEGLESEGRLHPMQQAFCDNMGFQCGYCTPGMLLTAVAAVTQGQTLDEPGARKAIEGNLCRCTGYADIVASIVAGARAMRGR
jgi:carbon-monoxide dehydrogenase small subunit